MQEQENFSQTRNTPPHMPWWQRWWTGLIALAVSAVPMLIVLLTQPRTIWSISCDGPDAVFRSFALVALLCGVFLFNAWRSLFDPARPPQQRRMHLIIGLSSVAIFAVVLAQLTQIAPCLRVF
jgi:hypothetical protein